MCGYLLNAYGRNLIKGGHRQQNEQIKSAAVQSH